MRKGLLVLLAMALVVALAVPASAEMKLNGFYRVRPTVSNYYGRTTGTLNKPGMESSASSALMLVKTGNAADNIVETDRTIAFTEMRNRLRFEVGDENVKGVSFFEIDGTFGDIASATAARNQGFASNGDSINIETKNIYVWFKVPNTTLDFTVGLQGYMDEFAGLLFGASDQAGVVANYTYNPVKFRFTWFKLRDDVTLGSTGAFVSNNAGGNEADYYAVDAKFNASKDLTATLHLGFIRDTNSILSEPAEASGLESLKSYYLGANATAKFAPATVTGFFLYNFGKFEDDGPAPEVKIAGYAGSLRADLNLGPGKAFLEGLYVSGDDDRATTTKYKGIITGSDYALLTSFYFRPDLQILFPNIDVINAASALVLNPNNLGRGVVLVAGGYSQKFSDKISGKIGAGYLAADKKRKASVAEEARGKTMGTEINANVNYNITKGLDFGLYGAYCFLGSFYDRPTGQSDPNDLYNLFGRLNFAF